MKEYSFIESLREHMNILHKMSLKPNFWIGKTGNKYPYHNGNIFHFDKNGKPIRDIQRYSPIERQQFWNGELVLPLPKDEYPYKLEYQTHELKRWD